MDELKAYLKQNLENVGTIDAINKFKANGGSTAGQHSLEEIFTREFLCPSLLRYFQQSCPHLSTTDFAKGLGTEGYQNCAGFGFTPASQEPHLFTKSDIVQNEPPKSWLKSSNKTLPRFQACPDFALRSPLPVSALGEVKLITKGDSASVQREIFNAARQAVFYLSAFRKEYESCLIVMADVTGSCVLSAAINELNPHLLERFGTSSGVYLLPLQLK